MKWIEKKLEKREERSRVSYFKFREKGKNISVNIEGRIEKAKSLDLPFGKSTWWEKTQCCVLTAIASQSRKFLLLSIQHSIVCVPSVTSAALRL